MQEASKDMAGREPLGVETGQNRFASLVAKAVISAGLFATMIAACALTELTAL